MIVVVLDKLTYASNKQYLADLPNKSHYHFYHGDIGDPQLVGKIMREHRIDTIVHFAAETHVDRSISGPMPFIQTNMVGTFTLLEAARQWWLDENHYDATQCRFHHISTDEVFGSLDSQSACLYRTNGVCPEFPLFSKQSRCRSFSTCLSTHLSIADYHPPIVPIIMGHFNMWKN